MKTYNGNKTKIKMKILVKDWETTGFSTSRNHVVELGLTEVDLKTGECRIVFEAVMREPAMTIESYKDSWIAQNSTLTVEEVSKAHFLEHYRPEIQELYKEYPYGVAAFNCPFDFRFSDSRGFRYRKLPCLMQLAKPIVGATDKNGKLKVPSVQEAYDYFFPNSGYVEKHRAGDDSLHEGHIAVKLYQMGILKV